MIIDSIKIITPKFFIQILNQKRFDSIKRKIRFTYVDSSWFSSVSSALIGTKEMHT